MSGLEDKLAAASLEEQPKKKSLFGRKKKKKSFATKLTQERPVEKQAPKPKAAAPTTFKAADYASSARRGADVSAQNNCSLEALSVALYAARDFREAFERATGSSPRTRTAVRASREVRVEGLIIRGLVLTSFCFQPVGRSRGVPSRRRRRSDLSARVARRDASDTTRGPVASEHLPESSRDARIGGAATATASSRSRTRGGRSESVRAKEGARCVGSDRAIRTSW